MTSVDVIMIIVEPGIHIYSIVYATNHIVIVMEMWNKLFKFANEWQFWSKGKKEKQKPKQNIFFSLKHICIRRKSQQISRSFP